MQMSIARVAGSILLSITTATSATTTYNPTIEYKHPSHTTSSVLSVQTTPKPSALPTEIDIEYSRKVRTLSTFLKKQHSPMTSSADTFIAVSEEYNIDWRLLPSIAGVESTFGKFVPSNSYNPFGWANGKKTFESWDQAIKTVGEGINRIYLSRGLNTPQLMQPIYAPPSSTWANKINHFYSKLDIEYNQQDSKISLSR